MSITLNSDRPRSGFDTRSLVITSLAIVGIALIAAAVLRWAWPDLPDRVATHWNGAGEPDSFTDRGAGLAVLLVGMPAAVGLALAVVMGFVPRSAPGTRWISAIPVGLAASMTVVTVGSAVAQRNGGEASIGLLLVLMLVVGVAATAAAVPLLPRAVLPASTVRPSPDAPRLADDEAAWWAGTARTSPLVVAGFVALCIVPAIVIALTTRLGTVIALVLIVPALLVLANSRFRITVGSDGLVASGAMLGWPRVVVPLDTITEARTRRVTIWQYGGIGLRIGPRGSGVITRNGEALVIERTDGSDLAITCDDPEMAAATVNTLRTRATS